MYKVEQMPDSALLDCGSVEIPGLLGNTVISHHGQSHWSKHCMTNILNS